MKTKSTLFILGSATVALSAGLFLTRSARAHCDTLDGPVVAAARQSLEKGDPTLALWWVKPEGEAEVRQVFQAVMEMRKMGAPATALADRYFFETLVRIHRAGEGEPYTGLKAAGGKLPEAIVEGDRALASGSIDRLSSALAEKMQTELKHRFEDALAKRRRANGSLDAGREYVESYVRFMHYAEGLGEAIEGAHKGHGIHD